MTINRNNYETYFLLYVDDELSVQEKGVVEAFVLENADLAAELDMFKGAKLSPETEIMFDKSFLYKQEGNTINLDNYREFFLLEIDKELPEKDKEELKRFLKGRPALEEELALLRKAVLPVEKVVFSDKSTLYRTEKRERRVVPFNWMRIGVAAAVIAVAVALVWIMVPSSSSVKQQQVVLVNKSFIHSPKKNIAAVKPVIINPEKNIVTATTITEDNKMRQQKAVAVKDTQTKGAKGINDEKDSTAEKDSEQNTGSVETQAAAVNNNAGETPARVQPNLPETTQKGISNVQNVYAGNTSNNITAQPAVYRELNTADEENKSLYLGSMEINKNKVRGLLKKAGRLFGGKAKDDAKDIKVANLDINTQSL
jgi:hypothetical protein